MAENRDDILNELIQYYDSKKTDAESVSEPEEDMGATRIIEKTPIEQPDTMGDTQVVGAIKTQPKEEKAEGKATSDTVRIDTASAAPEPAAEEILGNLSLDGDINSQKDSSAVYTNSEPRISRTSPYENSAQQQRSYENLDKYNDEEYYDEYYEDERGIWFSLKPLWITLILTAAVCVCAWFYLTDNALVGTYKRNFEYNMNLILDSIGIEFDPASLIPVKGDDLSSAGTGNNIDFINSPGQQYDEGADAAAVDFNKLENLAAGRRNIEKETVTLPFVDAGSSDFSVLDNGVVCAKSNYMCRYSNRGKLLWELGTNVANPIISASGKYIAVASDGGTTVNLYKNDKLQFSIEIENTVNACGVSERGDVVLITERAAYKGAVMVINRYGEEIFSWSSGVNYITAATISKQRVLSVALVDTSETVNSYVMMFDVSAPDPFAGIELQNTLVFDLFNNGKLFFATGDNSITAMNESCSLKYDKRFDDVYISHAAEDEYGNRIVAFTDNNIPILNLYSADGRLASSAVIENNPDLVDVFKSTVLYIYERDIVCGRAQADNKAVYTAPMAIKKALLLNSKSYVIIYENCIEFVHM